MSQSEVGRKSMILSALLNAAAFSVFAISVLMVVVTLAQVVFRYVIAAPLPWSEELARYCFVWIVFLGGAIGLSRGIHLGVDLFVNLLPDRFRPGLEALSNALIACFAAAVVYASYPVINMNMLQRSPAMGVQMSWIYIAIPISMCLIVLICVERIVAILLASRNR
ncbi:MAG: TRAP transporter small permease [Albidovulum sp.]|nr:TRAP transporter small permease [Albidovulum sp.]